MARKEYIGTFEMPSDLEKAAFEWCKALRRNGYNVGSTYSVNGLVESVHFYKWGDDEPSDDILLEYGADGKWHRYVWSDER